MLLTIMLLTFMLMTFMHQDTKLKHRKRVRFAYALHKLIGLGNTEEG